MDKQQEVRKIRKKDYQKIILIFLSVILVGTTLYFYKQSHNTDQTAAQKQIIDEIAQTVELPPESPVSVTVSDKTKLSNQLLAGRVENGDTLFIFNSSKKLIVYRPSTEKVVDILGFEAQEQLPVE